jgi:hypothetical protein
MLPSEPNPTFTGSALLGALVEGLVGPLAAATDGAAQRLEAVQAATLLALRALGVSDARARGLVVQIALPPLSEGAA